MGRTNAVCRLLWEQSLTNILHWKLPPLHTTVYYFVLGVDRYDLGISTAMFSCYFGIHISYELQYIAVFVIVKPDLYNPSIHEDKIR